MASLKISHIPCLSYLLMIYSTRMLYEVYCISTQDLEINRKELGLKPYIYININIYIYTLAHVVHSHILCVSP